MLMEISLCFKSVFISFEDVNADIQIENNLLQAVISQNMGLEEFTQYWEVCINEMENH